MKYLSLAGMAMAAGMALLGDVQGADEIPSIELKVAYPELKFVRPVALKEPSDGSKRLFLVEQDGRISILPKDRNGKQTNLFLDITARKPHVDNEEGLLSLAFHPRFKSNGKFYVYYNQQSPRRSVISEFQVSKADPMKADPGSERILLEVAQPYGNHKGGDVHFGPDGYLYITLGDGGLARDPHGNGQNLMALLGKILRIDVNGNLPYGIPRSNPFVTRTGARPEIWAYGLRNVWRMSFDRKTGELWAGEVGQDKYEEVVIVTKGGNYGWNAREAFHEFKEQPAVSAYIDPVIEYGHNAPLAAESKFPQHSPGLSITGGYVYRGQKLPQLRGVYVYGDFNLGTVWGLRYENGKVLQSATLAKSNPTRQISAFGEDSSGEIYMLAFDGRIYEFTVPAKK